jgi:transposase-like protein
MAGYWASFKCPKCDKTWETEFHEKPKQGFKDYCQCKKCLQVRKNEGGELRPLNDALTYRKA